MTTSIKQSYTLFTIICFLYPLQSIVSFQSKAVSAWNTFTCNPINDFTKIRSLKILHATTSEDTDKRYDGFPVWFRIAEQKIAAYEETHNPDSKNEESDIGSIVDDVSKKETIAMAISNIINDDDESELFAVQYPSQHWTMDNKTTFSKSSSFSYVLPKGIKLSGLTIKADEEDVDTISSSLKKTQNVQRVVDNASTTTKVTISQQMGYNFRIGA